MPPVADQWFFFSVLTALSSYLLLTLVFVSLYLQYREVHIRTWAWGWGCQALSYLLFLFALRTPHPPLLQPLIDLAIMANGLFLLRGTGQFVQRKVPRRLLNTVVVVGTGWIVLCAVSELPVWLETVPFYLFMAGVLLWTGSLLLRTAQRQESFARFTGGVLILWGLHKIDAPFLIHNQLLAPWGFLLSAILSFMVAMGMLLAYFQRVREKLQRSEERFRAISTYSNDWEIWLGLQGEVVWINAAASRMTGVSDDEALAMKDYPLPLIEGEDQPAFRTALELVADGGIIDDQLLRLHRPDGQLLWVSLSAQQLFSSDGVLLGSRLSLRDVSVLTHYQQAIDRKQIILQSVLDNTLDGMIALDEEFRVIYFNSGYMRLWGLSPDFLSAKPTMAEVIRKVCEGGLYPLDQMETLVEKRTAQLTSGGEKISLMTPRTDGLILESFAAPLSGIGYLLTYRDVTAQTLSSREIQRSREHYRTLIETVPHAIIECDLEGRILYANPTCQQMVASPGGEMTGRPFWEVLTTAEAAGAMEERFLQIRSERQTGSEIVRTEDAVGGRRWHKVDWNFLYSDEGQPCGYIAVITDITENRLAQKKEREQSLFLQNILDAVPAPIFYKDAAGLYLGCNVAFEAFIGRSRNDILGLTTFDVAPPDLAQIYYDADMALLRQGGTQVYETQVVYADGTRHDVLFTKAVMHREDGRLFGLVGVMLDISERKGVEQALIESEQRYRNLFHEFETIFNGIPDSLTVWGDDLRLIWANSSSSGYFGAPVTALIGKGCQELCRLHDAMRIDECEVRRSLHSGAVEEGIHKMPDGRTWGVKTFPLRNASGEVDRVIRLASDLTERIVLREEAARAAHLAALGELSAGMAHEINNPTSLILLEMPILQEVFRDSLEILEEYFRQNGDFTCGGLRYSRMRHEVPAMINEIIEGAERIRQIVEELKDFSQPSGALPFEAVDLNEVVRKTVSLIGNQVKKATAHFVIDYAPVPVLCLGSLHRLEQVVVNLVLNACQAMPDYEGTLTIKVGSRPDGRSNYIRVSDTGTGILPEHLDLITDPFFTTRRAAGGTGLGLSVSTRIVGEHRGSLTFDSEPGRGTIVTVELPSAAMEEKHE